ncbi:MAG: tetraacyldisaccharide 4'-kinase [Alphaproteobacteria bacterium]|nr:tetraacyldisaccharide 4'-kinase [Alphaproteobacteria bacterium]
MIPLSYLYQWGAQCRHACVIPRKINLPIICIGNLVMGGAGKTPTALALASWLREKGYNVHFFTRCFGWFEHCPVSVDLQRHTSNQVGDEALLLAKAAPTWVSRDRIQGAKAAQAAGAQLLIMDDGFQNPSLFKDLSLVVVDGQQGLGNQHVFPAGPLRESLATALRRAHGIVMIGQDKYKISTLLSQLPVLSSVMHATPDSMQWLIQKPIIAFAGLGYPEKFFYSLRQHGGNLIATKEFPDHHPYTIEDLEPLIAQAEKNESWLVTTEKDMVRVPKALQSHLKVFKITLKFKSDSLLESFLKPVL